jgi:hypothetical protein
MSEFWNEKNSRRCLFVIDCLCTVADPNTRTAHAHDDTFAHGNASNTTTNTTDPIGD